MSFLSDLSAVSIFAASTSLDNGVGGDEDISHYVHWVDYLVIALYFVIIIIVGIWVRYRKLFNLSTT